MRGASLYGAWQYREALEACIPTLPAAVSPRGPLVPNAYSLKHSGCDTTQTGASEEPTDGGRGTGRQARGGYWSAGRRRVTGREGKWLRLAEALGGGSVEGTTDRPVWDTGRVSETGRVGEAWCARAPLGLARMVGRG